MLIAQLSDIHIGHVGYLQYEQTFGARDSILRLRGADGTQLALVAVDSSKPDLDEGEIGREHNLIRANANTISVELRVPGGERPSLGEYLRDWPPELSARAADPLANPARGLGLAND